MDWVSLRCPKSSRTSFPVRTSQSLTVLPPAAIRDGIYALAEEQKRLHGFTGTLIRPEHLHVTLFHLGDWITLPEELIAQARIAAASVKVAAFALSAVLGGKGGAVSAMCRCLRAAP